VHVKGCLGENEGTSIRHRGVLVVGARLSKGGNHLRGKTLRERASGATHVGLVVWVLRTVPVTSEASRDLGIKGASIVEKTTSINEGTAISSEGLRTTESMDSVGESIDGISVVEGLGTEHLEEESIAHKGRAVIHVLIRLHNPDKLLHGVVEVELDLVGG